MSEQSTERRRFDRIATDKPVVIRADAAEHRGVVLDISLRGALLAVDDAWRPAHGQQVEAEVRLDEAMSCIAMSGEVAHVEGNRIGLHCLVLDLESARRLRRLVELNLADPELLERNLAELIGG